MATPAHQLDRVIDTGFRATYDHRAAAMIDDVERHLSPHAGTAADNNDLLGLKLHTRLPPGLSLTALTRPALSCRRRVIGGARSARGRTDNPAYPTRFAGRTQTAARRGELSSPNRSLTRVITRPVNPKRAWPYPLQRSHRRAAIALSWLPVISAQCVGRVRCGICRSAWSLVAQFAVL